MKISFISVVLLLSLLCNPSEIFAQESTYFKRVPIYNNRSHILSVDSTDLYVAGRMLCDTVQNLGCMYVARLDQEGEVIWKRNFPWSRAANRNAIEIRGDSLFISGHGNTSGNNSEAYHFLIMNTDGDSLRHKVFHYDLLTQYKQFYNNGIVLSGNDVFIYGQTSEDDFTGVCVIQKYNFITEEENLFLYYSEIGNYYSPGWNLTEDEHGDFIILNDVYEILSGINAARELLKINRDGEILKRLYGPTRLTPHSLIAEEFNILSDGNYLIVDHIDYDSFVNELVKMDAAGQILWTYAYPNHSLEENLDIGYKGVGKMISLPDGEILLSGTRDRGGDLGTGQDIYLARMSSDGEILWEHFYNTIVDAEEKIYDTYYTPGLAMMPNGDILILAGDINSKKTILLRVDHNGCLQNYNCEEEDILLNDSKVDFSELEYDVNVYPNPTLGNLLIDLGIRSSGCIEIYDLQSQLLKSYNFNNQNHVAFDITTLPSGVYFLKMRSEKGLFVKKIIKE